MGWDWLPKDDGPRDVWQSEVIELLETRDPLRSDALAGKPRQVASCDRIEPKLLPSRDMAPGAMKGWSRDMRCSWDMRCSEAACEEL